MGKITNGVEKRISFISNSQQIIFNSCAENFYSKLFSARLTDSASKHIIYEWLRMCVCVCVCASALCLVDNSTGLFWCCVRKSHHNLHFNMPAHNVPSHLALALLKSVFFLLHIFFHCRSPSIVVPFTLLLFAVIALALSSRFYPFRISIHGR